MNPSRTIPGSYFPCWTVCGLAAALAERVALNVYTFQVGRDLNWVVMAQRFPVWVRLESPPTGAMHVGMTASIKVRYGKPR